MGSSQTFNGKAFTILGLVISLTTTAAQQAHAERLSRSKAESLLRAEFRREGWCVLKGAGGKGKGVKGIEAEVKAGLFILEKESSLKTHAIASRGTSSGLAGFLDSTWKSMEHRYGKGFHKSSKADVQLRAFCVYVRDRYGSMTRAKQVWLSNYRPRKGGSY